MTQPPPTNDTQPPDLTPAYLTFQHYTALGFLIGAPVLIALPPRKLDFYTFALGSGFVLSASHLYRERSRRASPFGGLANTREVGREGEKKTRYEVVQEQLRRERLDQRSQRRLLELPPDGDASGQVQGVEEEEDGDDDDETGRSRSGIRKGLEKVWMGSEKPGWRERRLAEEQEKISQGEGYGGMIMDQIWEVWNWGKERGEELEEKDREALKEKRRKEEFPDIGKR